MPLKEWLRFGETESCSVIFRYCLALLMDRLSSWTAMAECWPTCSFMSQMGSSACPGTTPASWWRTAARVTRTLTTIPHHKVVVRACPSTAGLQGLMKLSQTPGSGHAVLKQRDVHVFKLIEAKSWWVPVQIVWGLQQRAAMGEWVHSQLYHQASLAVWLATGHTLYVLLCVFLHKWDNNTKHKVFSEGEKH